MKKLISIIIPVYNVEKYIHQCMESVMTQKHLNETEIILINDGSTDRSGEICDEYEERYPELVRAVHQVNKGLSMARNRGLELSLGEYIFFIDSDDTVEKDALDIICDSLKEYDYPDMLIFDAKIVDENNSVISPGISGIQTGSRPPVNSVIQLGNEKKLLLEFPSAWRRVTRKEIFTSNNILFPEGLWYEDIGTVPKLLVCSRRIVCIDKVLYNYLSRQGSITTSKNIQRRSGDAIKEFEILYHWFREKNLLDEYYPEIEYMAVSELLLTQAVMIIVLGGAYKSAGELVKFISGSFRNYAGNIYLRNSSSKNKLKVWLLKYRCFFVLDMIFRTKNKF